MTGSSPESTSSSSRDIPEDEVLPDAGQAAEADRREGRDDEEDPGQERGPGRHALDVLPRDLRKKDDKKYEDERKIGPEDGAYFNFRRPFKEFQQGRCRHTGPGRYGERDEHEEGDRDEHARGRDDPGVAFGGRARRRRPSSGHFLNPNCLEDKRQDHEAYPSRAEFGGEPG